MADRFLHDRVAVITGASRGIGRAIAVALAGAGAQLALVGRNQEKLDETLKLVGEAGALAETYRCDVREESQVTQLAGRVIERFGAVHILVNSAGVSIRKKLHEFTLDEWRLVMETNVTGVWLVSRALIPHMKGRGYGRILNLTSVMAHVSTDGRGVYSASKPAALRADPAKNADLMAQTPMRRWGQAEEIGALALYICSDAAAFMTGNDVL